MTRRPGRRVVGLWLTAALACATGCHAGVGPTISYAFGAGPRLGWEAGGGYAFVHGNVGQTFALGRATEPTVTTPGDVPHSAEIPRVISYAAFEPFFVVLPIGATVGVAVAGTKESGILVGAWGGFPFQLEDCHGDHVGTAISGAVGLRFGGGITELYFTPKVQFARCKTLRL